MSQKLGKEFTNTFRGQGDDLNMENTLPPSQAM